MNSQEQRFLSPSIVDPKSKNVSYDSAVGKLGGTTCQGTEFDELKSLMSRYAVVSRSFMEKLFPEYVLI